jgi:hypothetical protein
LFVFSLRFSLRYSNILKKLLFNSRQIIKLFYYLVRFSHFLNNYKIKIYEYEIILNFYNIFYIINKKNILYYNYI